jgi:hypothetical protein
MPTAIVAFIRHRAFIQSQCQKLFGALRSRPVRPAIWREPHFYRRSALLILCGWMAERIERKAREITPLKKPELFNGCVLAGHRCATVDTDRLNIVNRRCPVGFDLLQSPPHDITDTAMKTVQF